MRLGRDTRRVKVPANDSLQVEMRRLDRPFNDLTIWGVPASPAVVNGGKFGAETVNITGVTIQQVGIDNPDGNGTLTYTSAATTLDWQPPGSAGPGRAIDVSLGGSFELAGRSIDQPVNITGVTIDSVSSDAANGNGSLTYTAAGTLLQWQAPGAGAPGAAVNVGGGGPFTLNGGDGSTMDVTVAAGSLPVGDESDTIALADDTMTITVEVTPSTLPVGDEADTIAITTTFPPPRVRDFTTQVFFGPTDQGAPTARADDGAFRIYDPGDTGRIWPANEPTSNLHQVNNRVRGFPITVEIVNNSATDDLVMTVEFVYMVTDQG